MRTLRSYHNGDTELDGLLALMEAQDSDQQVASPPLQAPDVANSQLCTGTPSSSGRQGTNLKGRPSSVPQAPDSICSGHYFLAHQIINMNPRTIAKYYGRLDDRGFTLCTLMPPPTLLKLEQYIPPEIMKNVISRALACFCHPYTPSEYQEHLQSHIDQLQSFIGTHPEVGLVPFMVHNINDQVSTSYSHLTKTHYPLAGHPGKSKNTKHTKKPQKKIPKIHADINLEVIQQEINSAEKQLNKQRRTRQQSSTCHGSPVVLPVLLPQPPFVPTIKAPTITTYRDLMCRKPSTSKRTKSVRNGAGDVNIAELHHPDINTLTSEVLKSQEAVLIQLLDNIQKELEVVNRLESRSNWSLRQELLNQKWQDVRTSFMSHILNQEAVPKSQACTMCIREQAVLKCIECCHFLCAACDEEIHTKHPLHDRQVWRHGYFEYVPPTSTVGMDGTLIPTNRYLPLFQPGCPICQGYTSSKPSDKKCILITMKGRYDLKLPSYLCQSCTEEVAIDRLQALTQSGLWPGHPEDWHHIFDVKVFQLYDSFMMHMPGSSETALLRSLEDLSSIHGRVDTINPIVFQTAYQEWKYVHHELNQIQGFSPMECPCCTIKQHSAHVDGCRKLYRLQKVKRGSRESYYREDLFVDNNKIQAHMNLVYGKTLETGTFGQCGQSHWKAAKATSKTMKHQDETGIVMMTCRHTMVQKVTNMFLGENFAYAHYLHLYEIIPHKVDFMWYDIMCQYWKWAQKQDFNQAVRDLVNGAACGQTKPALSVMHAKAHSAECQVVWGGRYQEGAAFTSGEEGEQANGYVARLGHVTKNMTAANREEKITEHISFWNTRKIRKMTELLASKYKRVLAKTDHAAEELKKTMCALIVTKEEIQNWKVEIQQIAKDASGDHRSLSMDEIGQYFKLWAETQEACALETFLETTDDVTSIMIGSSDIRDTAKDIAVKLKTKRSKLKALEERILLQTHISHDDLLSKGRSAVANALAAELEDKIEMCVTAMQQRSRDISSLADTCKQRARLRQKNVKEKRKIEHLVDNYNTINTKADRTLHPRAEKADVFQGIYSWSETASTTYRMKKHAVDMLMEYERLIEERKLLQEEMKNFVVFYKEKCTKLEVILQGTQEEEITVTDSSNSKGRYAVPSGSSLVARESLVRKGIAFCRQQLQRAALNFKTALMNDGDNGIQEYFQLLDDLDDDIIED